MQEERQPCFPDLEEMYLKRLHAMTAEQAEARIRAGADICGNHDYLAAEFELCLVADWLKRQFTPDEKNTLVRGCIIGALSGGHIDGPGGASYSKSVLAQIADLLDIQLPEEIKQAHGFH